MFPPGETELSIEVYDIIRLNISKMDVLLTASCCCLVPTPVNSHVRAHNLLQVGRLVVLEMLAVNDHLLNTEVSLYVMGKGGRGQIGPVCIFHRLNAFTGSHCPDKSFAFADVAPGCLPQP